jgi:hypothetical protein
MHTMALPDILGHCNRSSGRGALLAQNVEQSELGRCAPVGAIPADQGTRPAATTKAVSPLQGVASYRHTVKQLLKSVVRQIRTLRSVGAGGGQLLPATRWAISDDCPYRDLSEHEERLLRQYTEGLRWLPRRNEARHRRGLSGPLGGVEPGVQILS